MPEVLGRLTLPTATAAPASPRVGDLWYDPVYAVIRRWNGYEWVYSQEVMRDRVEIMAPFSVPTTAVGINAAVEAAGWTISPLCPAGVLRVTANVILDHGTAQQGWASGRYMGVYLADATYTTVAPIPIGAHVTTRSDQTGGLAAGGLSGVMAFLTLTAEVNINPDEAGTRLYRLMSYVSDAALLNAQVFAHPEFRGFLQAEIAE